MELFGPFCVMVTVLVMLHNYAFAVMITIQHWRARIGSFRQRYSYTHHGIYRNTDCTVDGLNMEYFGHYHFFNIYWGRFVIVLLSMGAFIVVSFMFWIFVIVWGHRS